MAQDARAHGLSRRRMQRDAFALLEPDLLNRSRLTNTMNREVNAKSLPRGRQNDDHAILPCHCDIEDT